MTGTEFLSKVKELYPDTVRIVLSGYTDLKTITDAINQGSIFRFLTKPWDDTLLRANIEEAFQYYELQGENIRLTHELKQANNELSFLNQDLEKRVEEKTHEVILNMRAAQISQEVLENLPVAVLGIGDDGIIAVANQLSHELLGDEGEHLVGCPSEEVLPETLNEMLQYAVADGISEEKSITLNEKTPVEVCWSQLGGADHIQGTILVMRPLKDQVDIHLKRGTGTV
jgi:YesN/AraC family two-component response regulator